MKPIIPIIHQNGTHPDRLIQALTDFRYELSTLKDKLGTISPNGRDYYQDPGRMNLAVEQHQRRAKVLNPFGRDPSTCGEHERHVHRTRDHVVVFVPTVVAVHMFFRRLDPCDEGSAKIR